MKLYHASPKRNTRSILRGGIAVPKSGLEKAVFIGALDQVLGFAEEWAEEPGEPKKWSIFEVDTTDLPVGTEGPPEFEKFVSSDIPPWRVRLIGVYNAKSKIWEA